MPLLAGAESLSVWLADPTYPNTTLSWNMIHGKKVGMKTISVFNLYWSYTDVFSSSRNWYDYAGNIQVIQLLCGIG
jgi:hypothetical protein